MLHQPLPAQSQYATRSTLSTTNRHRRLASLGAIVILPGLMAGGLYKGEIPMPSSSPLQQINPQSMARPHGYTQVVTVAPGTRLVVISGQIGVRTDGTLVEGGFSSQAKQAFSNLAAALSATGTDFSHVIKLSMFVTDFDSQLSELRATRDAFVDVHAPPASTTVQVPRLFLKDALFEVDAIAVIPEP